MTTGTEVGVAYVSLVPSAKGFGESALKELAGPLQAASSGAGTQASDALSTSFLGGLKGAGDKALKLLGFAAIAGVAIKSAVDVEDAQNNIIRSTGATGKAAAGLEESFRNVASGTAASFETVSTTLSELYQRTGLQGKALEGLTSQVVSFNRQFKDSPITVDALTKALAGFNVPGDKMGQVLDHLFIISQKTGEPLQQLLTDVQTGGPVLRQFGFSAEDSASLLGKLNKAGLDANQIIPGLKKVFKDAADAGKDPQEALKGIVTQLDGLVKSGDIIGARNLAVQVFGPKGVGLVDAALSGKLSLDDFNKTISTTGDGIIDTGKKTGTLAGALGILRNNVQLALASFATPGLEAANSVLRDILPTIQDLGREFAQLPDSVKIGIVAIAGVGYGLGQIGSFATNVLPGILALGRGVQTAFELGAVKALELIEALGAVTLAEAAAAVGAFALQAAIGAAAGAAAFIATTALLNWLFGTSENADKATASMSDLAAAVKKVDGPTETLVGKFNDAVRVLHQAEPNLGRAALTLGAFRLVAEDNIDTAARLALQFPRTSAKFKDMAGILINLAAQHNASAAAAANQGTALAQVTGQVDVTTAEYKKGVDQFGVFVTTVAAAATVTGKTLDTLAEQSSTFSKSLEGGIQSFTDAFSHQFDTPFGVVAQQQFEDFFVGSEQQAADWAVELQGLISRGVDTGIIQEIAQAGPKSKPELDAFVQTVDEHGVDWVNSIKRSGDAAAAETEKAFNEQILTAAIKGAEQQSLTEAYQDAIEGHGTQKLEDLVHSTDKNLALMAYIALLRFGDVVRAEEGIPSNWPITLDVKTREALLAIAGVDRALADTLAASTPEQQRNVVEGIAAGYYGAEGGYVEARTGGQRWVIGEAGVDEVIVSPRDLPGARANLARLGVLGQLSSTPAAPAKRWSPDASHGLGFAVDKVEQNFYGELPSPAKQAVETARTLRNAAHLMQ